MLKLDHLTIIAPTLEQGVDHVRRQLGIDMPPGGTHPEMGTHNRLLRLDDDVFLEVIAVDPDAEPPARRRWFGLDCADEVERAWTRGDRLNGWVARTRDLPGLLERHGRLLGHATDVSRGDRVWQIAVPDDGSLPGGGTAPSVIDWGDRGSPASGMPDLGCRLADFAIEYPHPEVVRQLHADLGILDPPTVREAPRQRYRAVIATPAGLRELW